MWIFLFACGSAPPPLAADAVTYGESSVAVGLERLDARVDTLEGGPDGSTARLSAIEDRLTQLEIALAQSQIAGDDRPTAGVVKPGADSPVTIATMDARISKLEDKVFSGAMGDPGAALFDLPKDPPPPAGKGPGGAPKPPPGGGKPGGPGAPGGPGGPGGGQQGGGQGGGQPPQGGGGGQ